MTDLEQTAQRFPIGQRVEYRPIADLNHVVETTVRSEPWRLGHGAIVVKVRGIAGGVSTAPEHLKPID